MSEMVERVARAMWLDQIMHDGFPSPHPTWEEMKEGNHIKELVRSNARAAIAAMREPTSEMRLAGDRLGGFRNDANAAERWRAMIDVALAPVNQA